MTPDELEGVDEVAEPVGTPGAEDVQDSVDGAELGIMYSSRQLKRARDLLTAIYAARKTARLYAIDHPVTIESVGELHEVISEYHREEVDIELAFYEGELLFGEQLLPEESLLFDQLIRDLTSLGVGSLAIRRGINQHETQRFISVLASDTGEIERLGGVHRMAAEADTPHVDIGEVRAFDRELDGDGDEDAHQSYGSAIELMREIDTLVRKNRTIGTKQVKSVVRSLVDNVLSNRYAMLQLTGLKSHDEYTFYHSANVALLSLALGSMITNDYRFLSSLGTGALLHDIGKMTLDLDILNKPGALSAEEWALVRQHPVTGAEQAALIPGLDHSSIVIIFEHHMRFDQSGYPTLDTSRTQHLAARIVAVADSYDAMTSRRSYSAARMQDSAMATLAQGAGSSVDPTLTRLFVTLMGVYPPRTVVSLSDGSVGIVMSPSETDALRPVVRVIADPTGRVVEPVDIDLSAAGDLTVSRSLDGRALNVDVDEYV